MAGSVKEVGDVASALERPFALAAPAVFAHDKQIASRPVLDAALMAFEPILEPAELEVAQVQRGVGAEVQFPHLARPAPWVHGPMTTN